MLKNKYMINRQLHYPSKNKGLFKKYYIVEILYTIIKLTLQTEILTKYHL